jgi:hypothetical protein
MTIPCKIKNFYKRWNIVYDEDNRFIDFKNRTLSTVDDALGELFLSDENLERTFLRLIAKHFPQSKIRISISAAASLNDISKLMSSLQIKEVKFKDSLVYKFLSEEDDFIKFIQYLQSIFWLDLKSEVKKKLYLGFKEDIELSLLDIQIKRIKGDNILFYPNGAKLLDEKVVNDVLDWLISYPKVYMNFKAALEKYQNKISQRNLIDDLRLSLELLLKKILNNYMNLENQEKPLGEHLKKKNVPKQLRNMYWKLIDYYAKYQNNYAKHENKADSMDSSEIEFIIYLTGTFIRFLMTLEDSKNERK